MGTWPEAVAKRKERLEREAVRKARLGPLCPVCRLPTWKPLVDATNDPVHPACRPVES